MLKQHPDQTIAEALAHYPETDDAEVSPLGRGLIHDTYDVAGPAGHFVLQRVNPIFDPAIHLNIRAVTERLARRGVRSPQLVLSREGQPWLDLGDGGIWRLQTFVAGADFDAPSSARQVEAAAKLVAQFHTALDDWDYRFVGRRLGVHDTARHLEVLRAALRDKIEHPLHDEVAVLGGAMVERATELPPLPAQPERICHGDLKFNNVRFASAAPPGNCEAQCLIDLDTVGPMQLAHELGDAWRSWCNPAGEDESDPGFDLNLLEAAWRGYCAGVGRALSLAERRALLGGVEWVSLELAARFAADALLESYFGWDAEQYLTPGEHNLVRARGQWRLHELVVACRPARAALLEVPLPGR